MEEIEPTFYQIVYQSGCKVYAEPKGDATETGAVLNMGEIIEAINEVEVEGILFVELHHGGWAIKERGNIVAMKTVNGEKYNMII